MMEGTSDVGVPWGRDGSRDRVNSFLFRSGRSVAVKSGCRSQPAPVPE